VVTAHAAKLSLSGQNIYNGCCKLKIDFSKLTNLSIKDNNNKSRDYTKPTLSIDEQIVAPIQFGALGSKFQGMPFDNPSLGIAGFPLGVVSAFAQAGLGFPFLATTGPPSGKVLLVSNLNEKMIECEHLFILFGVYGDVDRVKILYNKKDAALIQMSEAQQASTVNVLPAY
jgi:polypyrimidine tract-binding protein 1